ncbi:MAG: carbohydrate ABC transporter permease [Clostridiales bacterium]|nr:carbohydrate ABC transporter permease [Clostridiales bacterium]
MKKSFTLTYEQIRQKQLRQSHALIIVGIVLLAIAVFGFSVFASGLRDKLYTRQLLISLTQSSYSTAIHTDDGGANVAGEDARAYLLNTVETAASKRVALLKNKLGVSDDAQAQPADDDSANAQIAQWNAQLAFVTEHIRTVMDDAANERIREEISEANAEAAAARDKYNAAAAESRSAGNKVTKAKGKLSRGVMAQEEYDELVKAQSEADALKNAAYEEQSAALERLSDAYMEALDYMPALTALQKLCLSLSSVAWWIALCVLGLEAVVIGVLVIKKAKYKPSSLLMDVLIYDFFIVLGTAMLLPLLYVAVGSVSSTGLAQLRFGRFDLSAYRMIALSKRTLRTLGNSFVITIAGTLFNITITAITAYGLSKKDLPGRKWMMRLVVIFMLFHAGLIPDYMLVANTLHLTNTYWAIWLPVLISSSNLIIMKNFFQQLPESIEESARIDGCNEMQSFLHIVLPMSMASIATFSLFYAVGHWNNYQRAMIYLSDDKKYPITVLLRQIVILSQGSLADDVQAEVQVWAPTSSVKYATIMVGTIPIICVYPFLQKHFTKGVLMGSVKG